MLMVDFFLGRGSVSKVPAIRGYCMLGAAILGQVSEDDVSLV